MQKCRIQGRAVAPHFGSAHLLFQMLQSSETRPAAIGRIADLHVLTAAVLPCHTVMGYGAGCRSSVP